MALPSMQRIVKNRSGSFDVYAGDYGEHIATVATEAEAKEVLEEWVDFRA